MISYKLDIYWAQAYVELINLTSVPHMGSEGNRKSRHPRYPFQMEVVKDASTRKEELKPFLYPKAQVPN